MAAASHAYAFSTTSEGSGAGSFIKSDTSDATSRPFRRQCAKPVDLVHLSRQSLGDRELEVEILGMFLSQSQLYIDRLANATTTDERKLAAHTILGSARGIGAWNVAEEAEKVELTANQAADLGDLRRALDQTNSYIGEILSDA